MDEPFAWRKSASLLRMPGSKLFHTFRIEFFGVHYSATFLGYYGLLTKIINIQAALHCQKAPNTS